MKTRLHTLTIFLIIQVFVFQILSAQSVMVSAHRGDWRNFPENSLEAFESAINMGVEILEVDVRKTADGHFVVLHDKTLERTTTGRGLVKEKSLAELKTLVLRNGYGMPTEGKIPELRDIYKLARGKAYIYLDKSTEYIDELYELALEYGMADKTYFYGYQKASELKEKYPKHYSLINYIPRVKDNIESVETYLSEWLSQPNVEIIMIDFASDSSNALNNLSMIKEANRKIWMNALWPELNGGHDDNCSVKNPEKGWGRLVKYGADIICTDRPQLLIEYLKEKHLHN